MAGMPGLIIKIGANTKDAIDGLNKVNRAIGQSASGTAKMNAMLAKAGPAFAAAAVGVGALAAKLTVDSARAWMDEEKSLAQINTALKNLGYESATAEVATFIDNLQYSANVADSELRPAFSRLARSTGDIAEAQRALGIALDISAATGKNLDTVANGLGKAYDGNAASLGRLGLGLDKATLKGGDMVVITEQLIDKFGGARAAQQNTLSGAISGVSVAWDELQESFGKGLVGGSGGDTIKGLEDAEDRLRKLQPSAERAGASLNNLAVGALEVYDNFVGMGAAISEMDFGLMRQMLFATDKELVNLNKIALSVGAEFSYTQYAAYGATKSLLTYKTAAEDTTKANEDQVTSIKRLQDALSGLGKKQGLMEQRFGLNQLLTTGPGKSGVRKGADGSLIQFTTGADRKEFAFSVASSSRALADSLLGDRKRGAARNTLRDAREVIRSLGLPSAFEENLLETVRTPSALRPTAKPRPGTPQSGSAVSQINYNFYGGIKVDSGEAARQAAKEARRLASLSGSRYAGMAETGEGYAR